jgi:sugar-specific transcriptional regulator TrmB
MFKTFDPKGAKILNQLGLSPYQAKVYIVLVKCGTLTAKEISGIASIPRQEVYRITSELLEKGFIERHITVPESFHASEIKLVMEALLELHQKENNQFEKAITEFLEYGQSIRGSLPILRDRCSNFVLIPGGKSFVNRTKHEMEQTRKCLDLIVTLKDFKEACFNNLWDWAKLLKRDIRVRWIVTVPPEKDTLLVSLPVKVIASELRIIYGSDLIRLGLYDCEKAFVGTSLNNQRCPFLFTDNHPLVSALQCYYKTLWDSALSLDQKELPILPETT